jgi:arylsulfatase A-like enzyme
VNYIRTVLLAALGGACGGALVGLAEATLVAMTGAPEELWLFPFGIVSYGAIGAAFGVGVGLLLAALAVAGIAGRRVPALGWGAALSFLPLGLAIGRYHLMQRLFGEGLAIASPTGAAVHLGLLLGAAVIAALVFLALRGVAARPVVVVTGWFALLGVAASAALVAGDRGGDGAPVERRADPAAAGRPNVILVVMDTLRVDAINAHLGRDDGGVARLARDGVRFANAHSQASWTRPSMASLLTSQYPSQHGAVQKTSLLSDRLTTLAEAFAAAGYWTAGFTTNINLAPIFNFQQGFDEYAYLEPSFYFGATDSATRLAVYKGLRVVREWLFRDRIYFQNYYQDAEVVGAAVGDWLAEAPPQPFFLLVHYMDPHDPYFEMPYNGRGVARVIDPDPPAANASAYHELYGEGVEYVEKHFGGILADLEQRGLYGNSVIALTSDHGEEFQEHGGWWHGTTLYQEQLHVPLVIKQAGPRTAAAVDERVVEHVDVAPTLMRAAGLEPPDTFVGRDLFIPGPGGTVFAEVDHEGNRLTSLRQGDWKIIVANPDNPRGLAPVELYDLATDPDERNDLAPTDSARVEEMMRALTERRAALRRGS